MLIDVNVEMYPDVLKHFPNYNYRTCYTDGVPTLERVDYRRGDNVTGHQQRAFIMWWAIRALSTGIVGLEWGGAVSTPGCIDVDKFSDRVNPGTGRSDGHAPHLVMDACNMYLLGDGKFSVSLSNHVLEHVDNPDAAMSEAVRVLIPGGYLAHCVPDSSVGPWTYENENHVTAFLPNRSKNLAPYEPALVGDPKRIIYVDEWTDELCRRHNLELIERDTFQNNFSINFVLKKV